ncbi:MAG: hypothetical protein OXI66_12760 [Boseongicola sp.]|nr:hypothetical protein [Boseongicola sp.]
MTTLLDWTSAHGIMVTIIASLPPITATMTMIGSMTVFKTSILPHRMDRFRHERLKWPKLCGR